VTENRTPATTTRLAAMAGDVVKLSAVLLLGICAG